MTKQTVIDNQIRWKWKGVALLFCLFSNSLLCIGGQMSYCVTKLDGLGMIYNSTEGKDRTYESSNYFNATSLILKKLPGNWEKIFSNSSKADKIEKLILDERWEHFANNPKNEIPSLLKLNNFAFSAKIYQNYNLFEKASPPKWKHYYASLNGNGFLIQSFDSNVRFSIDAKGLESFFDEPANIWKIHSNSFWYTEQVFHDTIYSNFENCTLPPNKKCVYFYLAMCEKCTLSVVLFNKEDRILNKETFNVPAEGKWYKQSICAKSMTDCFSVKIQADVENGFWAIGDMYLSSCQNDFRYLTLPNTPDVTGCENVYNNPTNVSSDIKTVCILYVSETDILYEDNYEVPETDILYEDNYDVPETDILYEDNYDVSKTENNTITTRYSNYDQSQTVATSHIVFIVGIAILLTLTLGLTVYRIKIKIKRPYSSLQVHHTVDIDENFTNSCSTGIQRPPKISEFEKYLREKFEGNEKVENEFKLLSKVASKSCSVALLERNKNKNVHSHILPYDSTRVILKRVNRNLDYINACYIEGLESKRDYILTQNPLPNTVDDYWYMVWQEAIDDIIMVHAFKDTYTEFLPKDKKPFTTSDGIEVILAQMRNKHQCYIHRIIHMQKDAYVRQINHYHFDWCAESKTPIFGLVNFLNDVLLKIPRQKFAPILIQSRGGVGRSGVLILCDIVIRKAEQSNVVDIFGVSKRLKNCHANIVMSLGHYRIAHLILLKYFKHKNVWRNDN